MVYDWIINQGRMRQCGDCICETPQHTLATSIVPLSVRLPVHGHKPYVLTSKHTRAHARALKERALPSVSV